MTYSGVQQQVQDKLSTIFGDLGVFFAFNDEQMTEGLKKTKTKKKDIRSIHGGGFVSIKNAEQYMKQTSDLMKWQEKEVKKLDSDKVIEYELANHECYYTGDISTAHDILKAYDFSLQQVQEVYNKTAHKHDL